MAFYAVVAEGFGTKKVPTKDKAVKIAQSLKESGLDPMIFVFGKPSNFEVTEEGIMIW